MSIKDGIFDIIGKTIKEVIINEGCEPYPNYHIFIVFSDDSFYEFYGAGHVNSTSGLQLGTATSYAKVFSSCLSICRYYKDSNDKCLTEEIAR